MNVSANAIQSGLLATVPFDPQMKEPSHAVTQPRSFLHPLLDG